MLRMIEFELKKSTLYKTFGASPGYYHERGEVPQRERYRS